MSGGMGKIGGPKSPPLTPGDGGGTAADSRRRSGGAAFHKADDAVAQGRRLPGIGRDPLHAEKCLGNVTVARAPVPSVAGLKHQPQASALLAGHAGVGWHGLPTVRMPEAVQRLDAAGQVVVKGDQGGDRCARFYAGKQKVRRRRMIRCFGRHSVRRRAGAPQMVGKLGEDGDGRVDPWGPTDRLTGRGERGFRGDIVTPRDARPRLGEAPPCCRSP